MRSTQNEKKMVSVQNVFSIYIYIFFLEKMPELAEVESSRAFISGLLTGYTVEEVHTREQGGGPRDGMFDDLVFELHPEGSGK